MESIYSSPEHDSRPPVAAERRRCYLDLPASSADVMREQMGYLLNHAGAACFPGCPDCARLEQVKRCLLRPFC